MGEELRQLGNVDRKEVEVLCIWNKESLYLSWNKQNTKEDKEMGWKNCIWHAKEPCLMLWDM